MSDIDEKNDSVHDPREQREYQFSVKDVEQNESEEDDSPSRLKKGFLMLVGVGAVILPLVVWQFVSFEVAVIFVLTFVWISLITD